RSAATTAPLPHQRRPRTRAVRTAGMNVYEGVGHGFLERGRVHLLVHDLVRVDHVAVQDLRRPLRGPRDVRMGQGTLDDIPDLLPMARRPGLPDRARTLDERTRPGPGTTQPAGLQPVRPRDR